MLLATVEPPRGRNYESVQYNGQTIYIYAHYSAEDTVANAIRILSYVPSGFKKHEPAVALRFAQ